MIKLLIIVFITLSLSADEYDFDISALEPQPYEYSGYLRVDEKAQKLNQDDEYQNYIHTEALLNFSYFYEKFTFKTSLLATYDHIEDKLNERDASTNELYLEIKFNTNHALTVGKESLKWGKGYYFTPIAFFDRPKDPIQPTQTREGFTLAKYSYNKSFAGDLKNLSFDIVYLPSNEDINKGYYELNTNSEDANNIAMRLYLLLFDTDIDFIYNYSDIAEEKIGIDFSKNIQVNFEVHGEYAKTINADYSYLLGLRYLTNKELTIISEYLYNSDGLNIDYLITSFTQKEPFELLYFGVYYKNTINFQDYSAQHKTGISYSFKNNINVDLSYNKNIGDELSEFGKKIVSDFVWLQVTLDY